MNTLESLFVRWDLDTWANILEVVGFVFSVGSLVVSLIVKSKVDLLRTEYLFDNTVNAHIKKLDKSTSEISRLLNDYDSNRYLIQVEFSLCISELVDIQRKVGSIQEFNCKGLITFLKARNRRPFADKGTPVSPAKQFWLGYTRSLIQTTEDDVWKAYRGLNSIIRQLNNMKLNRSKSK